MTDQPQQPEPSNSVTNVSGGVNANAEQVNVGADVVGRDKIVHIDTYYAGGEAARESKPRIYHNLPQPDYVRFVGRETELTKLHTLLSPDNRTWVIVIDGIGGIGKSSLALEVAHDYLNRFVELPERQCFKAIIWTSAKALTLTADGPAPRQQITRTFQTISMQPLLRLCNVKTSRAPARTSKMFWCVRR